MAEVVTAMPSLFAALDRAGLAHYYSRLAELQCVSTTQLLPLQHGGARAAFLEELRPFPGHRQRLEAWLDSLRPEEDDEPVTAEQQKHWRKSLTLLRHSASGANRGRDSVRLSHMQGPKGATAPLAKAVPTAVRVVKVGTHDKVTLYDGPRIHRSPGRERSPAHSPGPRELKGGGRDATQDVEDYCTMHDVPTTEDVRDRRIRFRSEALVGELKAIKTARGKQLALAAVARAGRAQSGAEDRAASAVAAARARAMTYAARRKAPAPAPAPAPAAAEEGDEGEAEPVDAADAPAAEEEAGEAGEEEAAAEEEPPAPAEAEEVEAEPAEAEEEEAAPAIEGGEEEAAAEEEEEEEQVEEEE